MTLHSFSFSPTAFHLPPTILKTHPGLRTWLPPGKLPGSRNTGCIFVIKNQLLGFPSQGIGRTNLDTPVAAKTHSASLSDGLEVRVLYKPIHTKSGNLR